jgi:hypothetical protein
MKITLVLLSLLALNAFADPKNAQGGDPECEANLAGMKRRSDEFRSSVEANFNASLKSIRDQREASIVKFKNFAKMRQVPLRGIPSPILKDETLTALRDFIGRLPESHPWSLLSSRDRESKALEIIKNDPYISWLMVNAVDNRVEKIKHGQNRSEGGRLVQELTSTDPIESLLECILIGGNTNLSPELAALRTILYLDPKLTPELRVIAERTLLLQKQEVALLEHKYLIDRESGAMSVPEAWAMARSLKSAQTYLRSENQDLVERYESQFPKETYFNSRKLLRTYGRVNENFNFVLAYKYRDGLASRGPVDLNQNRQKVLRLRETVGAPDESKLSNSEFMDALAFISDEQSADYDRFLRKVFVSPNDDGAEESVLSYLRQIVEIAQALESPAQLELWFRHELKKMKLWY